MYRIDSPAVLAHESVMSNPIYRERVERVAGALVNPREVIAYRDEELPELIEKYQLFRNRVAMGTLEDVRDPVLLFNTWRFDDASRFSENATARLEENGIRPYGELRGSNAFHWANYNQEGDEQAKDKVCRPCWRIHMEHGCLHRCMYCGLGGLLTSMVNVEEFCEHLDTIMEAHPWQKTYLLDDDADPPGLEPEFGCLGKLIEHFGTKKDRYLVIHTKTWNTEWMRDLKHNGNTIIVWSIGGPAQSSLIEPNTGTTEQRVEAARIAEEAGCQIRYKFKPIIPVRTWREDAAATMDMIFSKTHPDVISMCCFMWMDVDEMKRRLAPVLDQLDPVYLKAAEDGKEEMAQYVKTLPFPPWVREEIYSRHLDEIRKHDKDVPVSLSTENWDMWSKFEKKLGAGPANYTCGCGPMAAPGAKKLDCHAFNIAVRQDIHVPCVTIAQRG